MKVKFILLLVLFTLFSVNTFAQKQSASAFVQSFYKFHRTRSGTFDKTEVELHKKWFTAELIRLIEYELEREAEFLKENPTFKPHYGDGFPFVPLEDCYVKQKWIRNVLRIGKTSVRGDKTLVAIKFYHPKVCEGHFIHAYKIELVKHNGSWLINDLIFLDDNTLAEYSLLTDDLKREKY